MKNERLLLRMSKRYKSLNSFGFFLKKELRNFYSFIVWQKRCNAGRRDKTMSMDISVIFSWWSFAIFQQRNSENYVFQVWVWLILPYLGEISPKFWYPKNEKKSLMDMQSVVPNSSSTQNRDLLCFFPFLLLIPIGDDRQKRKKLGEFFYKNWNGCWSRHSVSGDFPSQTAR